MSSPLPLPPLAALTSSPADLSAFLVLLLETTPPSTARLAAELGAHYAAAGPPASHADVLRLGEELVERWEGWDGKVGFVEGHPRIGEGDVLSELSRREQGLGAGGPPTTQATLDSLKDLNAAYELAFPRLRYITFVNGRSRAAIVPELAAAVGAGDVRPVGSAPWAAECARAVGDVWRIAHARLAGLLGPP